MSNTLALTGTLDTIRDNTNGDKIDVGELVEALNSRGYGPFLVGPALITILPTGAIPGMPSICALLIIFVSIQLLMGFDHPWIPKRLKDFSFSREKFLNALDEAKPYTRKVDKFIYPRLTFLVRDEIEPVIALVSILLSVAIMIMGFIPFLAILPALGILLLGLGLSGKDGLLLSFAFVTFIASGIALPYFWTQIFG